jgi:putative oxidoreductase
MKSFTAARGADETLLVGRLLLVILFVISGWAKLWGFSGTIAYMTQTGAPVPILSAVIAVFVELILSIMIIVGALTRPMAVLLALYTLGTALIGHHYWTFTGPPRAANMINFYKNVSIVGGFLLLYVSGPGRYSVDSRLRAT